MKGFAALCFFVLGLMPTASLAADLPLTPQILDQIKADIEAYEERLNDPEDMNEALIGRISGLQTLIVLSAVMSLNPLGQSPLNRSSPRIHTHPYGWRETREH